MTLSRTQPNRGVVEWQSLELDPLLPIKSVAQQLNVSRDSVARWLRQHKIRGVKVGGRLRIRRSVALSFIRSAEYERDEGANDATTLHNL